MKKPFVFLTSMCAMTAFTATADEYADWEAYVGAGHYVWDDDRNLDNSIALEGGLEVPLTERLSLEAWLNDFESDVENTNQELDGNRYSLGALYHLADGDLRPFVSLGGSHLEFDNDGADFDESLVHLGIGAKKYFDNNLVLRGEALAMNSLDNELTDFGIRLAVGYAFGRSAGQSSAPVQIVPNSEADKPEVKKPEPVAEEKPVVAVEPKEVTPAPAPVVDTDGDGIADDKDNCPGTDKAFQVNSEGCPMKLVETVTIDMDVKFKTNSAEVSANKTEITALADFLKRFADTSVEVEGHTDSQGPATYNQKLSQKRADAVKTILIDEYGIAADRVTATGYGEAKPIADNSTKEGRATNRRVVAKVSADYEKVQLK